jgi:hypothetical protein
LGQATPSLVSILEGQWPQYTALDAPEASASKVATSGD